MRAWGVEVSFIVCGLLCAGDGTSVCLRNCWAHAKLLPRCLVRWRAALPACK